MTNSLEPGATFGGDSAAKSAWRWRFEDSSGAEAALPDDSVAADSGGFASQGDAESWIGEFWRDLLDEGVDQVSLLEADQVVYGPMSLHTPGGSDT